MHFLYSRKFLILVAILLFLVALLSRYSAYLDYQQLEKPPLLTSTIGQGTDQDSQIKCAQVFAMDKSTVTHVTHYDYLFMCPYMGYVIENLGFINGLQTLMYSTIIMGALVAVAPFVLLSYLQRKFSAGGLLASLILAFNLLLIHDSSGGYMIYPLSTVFFTIMYVFFFLALYQKKLIWVIALGIAAGINGLNKPFFLINDIPLLVVFSLLYLVSDFKIKETLPFFKVKFSLSKKDIFHAFLPLFILLSIAIGFEYYYYTHFGRGAYLGDTFFPKEKTGILRNQVLGHSLLFDGPVTTKIKNITNLLFKGLHETVALSAIPLLYMISTLVLLILRRRRRLKLGLIVFGISTIATIVVYFVSKSILANSIYVPLFTDWTILDYMNVTLLIVLFVFIFFQSRVTALAVFLKIFYLFSLSMTLSAVNQPQLFVTIVIWVALCIALVLDDTFKKLAYYARPRVYYLILGLFFISFFPSIISGTALLAKRQNEATKEKQYLTWVGTTIPENGAILGGANDNLVWLSTYTKRTIIYNGFYVASIIPYNARVDDIKEFPLPDGIPGYIQQIVEKQPDRNNLYILDEGVQRWTDYLKNGWTATYPKNKYILIAVYENKKLGRKIYKLKLNPSYMNPGKET